MVSDKINNVAASSPSKIEGAGGSMTKHHEQNNSKMKTFRRKLRNNSTLAEKTLWNWLKDDNINGLRFRRQYSIGNYILDFYCPKLKFAIELDGDYHYHGGVGKADYFREQYLKQRFGITTLRFENCIALQQPYVIINAIINFADKPYSPGACATPSSLEGELFKQISKLFHWSILKKIQFK